ncbi:MAG: imelysin family protein [Rhizobacter sp.]|nr:imelysin family protein [Chlorobiales bacterium]
MKKYIWLSLLLFTALAISACGDKTTDNTGDAFDRKPFLDAAATAYIIPAYQDLEIKVTAMDVAAQRFTASPSVSSLTTLQAAWDAAYLSWQAAQHFEFGPAETSNGTLLLENIGKFPANISKIESFIAQGDTSQINFNVDTRGFIGIDYLIFSQDGDANTVVARYTTETFAANRRGYLRNVIGDLKSKTSATLSAWQNGYSATFTSNTGTDGGSGTSLFYNAFVASFENLKNLKMALPAGKRAGQTAAEPTKVEAYYSGRSVKFMKAHLISIESLWLGRSLSGTDGIGFEEYLRTVDGGEQLIADTKAQLQRAKNALDALPETVPFSQTIVQNFAPVDAANTELQKQTRYFKGDMASLLGLTITYSSNDGD